MWSSDMPNDMPSNTVMMIEQLAEYRDMRSVISANHLATSNDK